MDLNDLMKQAAAIQAERAGAAAKLAKEQERITKLEGENRRLAKDLETARETVRTVISLAIVITAVAIYVLMTSK